MSNEPAKPDARTMSEAEFNAALKSKVYRAPVVPPTPPSPEQIAERRRITMQLSDAELRQSIQRRDWRRSI
jgi:hypothetical protein